jgi:hypothetical protein
MQITHDMIQTQKIVGVSSKGKPLVYILSKGGLHAVFTKDDSGTVLVLGTSPHIAITRWLSEKRDPGLSWDAQFTKSEIDQDELKKSEGQAFLKLREAFFYPAIENGLEKSENCTDYLVYDTSTKVIGMMDLETVLESIEKGEIDRFCLVRRSDLTEPPTSVEFHPVFSTYFKR